MTALLRLSLVLLAVALAARARAEQPEPAGVLRLPEALAAALEGSPELASGAWELRVREARELQASLRRNPELTVELEDFGGRDELRGFESSQTTLQLSQIIELGGKRAARVRAATLEREVAEIDFEARRLDVLASVTRAFVDVLAAQERVRVARDRLELAGELRETAVRRLRAGSAPAVEVSRAEISETDARVEATAAELALEAARQELAAHWGSASPRFERAVGDLERVEPVPELPTLRAALDRNPDVRRWVSERSQRAASLELARSHSVPNLEVGPGVRWLAGPSSAAFLVSASIPIPLFDRNQGGVAEAGSRLAQAADAERAARARAGRELAREHQSLVAAYAAATALQREIVPMSRAALDQVRAGYARGRFSQLDVIEAQRTSFAARERELAAVAAYHRGVAAIERLIAAPLREAP